MVKKPYIYVDDMDTPAGMITIACHPEGVCNIEFGDLETTYPKIQTWAKKNMIYNEIKKDSDYTREAACQLAEYFAGERKSFDLPLYLKGTPFQIKVWQALQDIGYGETKTYKDIAEAIGNPKAVRAVGGANNKNPISIVIPCHRVIGSSGCLIGYGGGLDKKQILLEHEQRYLNN
ncbi:methylated-DNA-[protein]-cysteine S-methyltransferase [Scopulibacillus daqui]|uniref:Methylated-DNA--protein-cysteine methyltransferase n=1 Tax=Scopulibacillus daqui TaxID=1469162 RepID=A0ABS2Q564_9BACL|nr:methylated-DNA--[protein]-cysteine S-methyltransferase [Scopulibacillus daqui]MBM7646834.1 methylated-DNA-[protein]-cysteine S-methyltransferase [Scopulibacillus daqui]